MQTLSYAGLLMKPGIDVNTVCRKLKFVVTCSWLTSLVPHYHSSATMLQQFIVWYLQLRQLTSYDMTPTT